MFSKCILISVQNIRQWILTNVACLLTLFRFLPTPLESVPQVSFFIVNNTSDSKDIRELLYLGASAFQFQPLSLNLLPVLFCFHLHLFDFFFWLLCLQFCFQKLRLSMNGKLVRLQKSIIGNAEKSLILVFVFLMLHVVVVFNLCVSFGFISIYGTGAIVSYSIKPFLLLPIKSVNCSKATATYIIWHLPRSFCCMEN